MTSTEVERELLARLRELSPAALERVLKLGPAADDALAQIGNRHPLGRDAALHEALIELRQA